MPRLASLYFKTAIVFLLIGIAIGLQMSISGNHNVTGAHAHINVLGWVTSALFGGYYALNPAKAQRRMAMVQYAVYVAGVVIMTPALYVMLAGNAAAEPIVAIGSLIAYAGVILFAFIVFSKDEESTVPSANPLVG